MNFKSYALLSGAAMSLANTAYSDSTEDTDETFIPLFDTEDVNGSVSGSSQRRSPSYLDASVITAGAMDTRSEFEVFGAAFTAPPGFSAAPADASIQAAAAPLAPTSNFTGSYTLTPPAGGVYTGAGAVGTFGAWTSVFADGTANTTPTLDTSSTSTLTLKLASSPVIVFGTTADVFSLTAVAAGTGTVSFNYNFTADAASLQSSFLRLLNGTPTPITSISSTGSVNFAVNAGDTFGFRLIDGSSYFAGLGTASAVISNFDAPVPEPSAIGLLATGFVGLLGFRENRRRLRKRA